MLSIVHSCAERAREAGYPIDAHNRSSWLGIAKACGYFGGIRKEAKQFVIRKFGRKRIKTRRDYATERAVGEDFLLSFEWRKRRMEILKRDGAKCACCGATPKDGVRVHVDHIKPRKKHPELALDPNNLQVLCEVCNHGKGNWDTTDWR